MKKTTFILVAMLPLFVFSQKNFEGRITYSYGAKEGDSIQLIPYFSSGKIRIEMNIKSLSGDPYRSEYFLADPGNKNYYMINDSQKVVTKLLWDSAMNFGFDPGIIKLPGTKKTIQGFECYGLSKTKTDTLRIMDTSVIFKSKLNFWYATDLCFPYRLEQGFLFSPILHDKNICLLVEILLPGDDPSANNKITIAADTIEQIKLQVGLFQIPTTYTVKYEKASNIFNTKTEVKVTDIKLEELESILPPPPSKDPKSSKSPIQKEKETKPVKG